MFQCSPLLSFHRYSYFNPQVAEWTEDLVAKEAAMKATCGIFLYVVDAETRALASMVEAAELVVSASRTSTHVVLVIHDVAPSATIAGEAIPPGELRDLNRARAYLADVTSRHATIVLNSVEEASRYCIELWTHYSEEEDIRKANEIRKRTRRDAPGSGHLTGAGSLKAAELSLAPAEGDGSSSAVDTSR